MSWIDIPPLPPAEEAENKAWVFNYQGEACVTLQIQPGDWDGHWTALTPAQARRVAYLLVQAADTRDGLLVRHDATGYERKGS